jgi:hypothetical protein
MTTMTKGFEERFFDQLDKNFDELNKKVDKNTDLTLQVKDQASKTAAELQALKTEVYKKKHGVGDFIKDKQLIGGFITAVIILLYIIANIMGIKVSL